MHEPKITKNDNKFALYCHNLIENHNINSPCLAQHTTPTVQRLLTLFCLQLRSWEPLYCLRYYYLSFLFINSSCFHRPGFPFFFPLFYKWKRVYNLFTISMFSMLSYRFLYITFCIFLTGVSCIDCAVRTYTLNCDVKLVLDVSMPRQFFLRNVTSFFFFSFNLITTKAKHPSL